LDQEPAPILIVQKIILSLGLAIPMVGPWRKKPHQDFDGPTFVVVVVGGWEFGGVVRQRVVFYQF